jgi:hypothetical protein
MCVSVLYLRRFCSIRVSCLHHLSIHDDLVGGVVSDPRIWVFLLLFLLLVSFFFSFMLVVSVLSTVVRLLFSLCGGLVMSVLLPSTYPFAVAL